MSCDERAYDELSLPSGKRGEESEGIERRADDGGELCRGKAGERSRRFGEPGLPSSTADTVTTQRNSTALHIC